jgi:hypothetical protein
MNLIKQVVIAALLGTLSVDEVRAVQL